MAAHTAEPNPAPSARRLATRARLLEAAAEVFVEEGLQGASVEAVCTRAGFTRGAFYSNFESKEQLFLALLQEEFERRAADLEAKAAALEPVLRERRDCVRPPEAAQLILEFFMPASDATAWAVLEAEFLLLAMRDPSLAPGHTEFLDSFYTGISGVIERVIGAAGRRFTLPVERAVPVLAGVYERALRTAAIAGADAPGGLDELGDRLAELLFALTETVGEGEPLGAPAEHAAEADPE